MSGIGVEVSEGVGTPFKPIGVDVDAAVGIGVPIKLLDVPRTRAETMNFPRAIRTSPLVA